MQQARTNLLVNAPALRYGLLLGLLALLWLEPALANKFETIGGGVSGSSGIKREWLQKFFFVVGGISLLSAVLALVVPHNNALYLNYGNWKHSSVILFILAAVFVGIAFVI